MQRKGGGRSSSFNYKRKWSEGFLGRGVMQKTSGWENAGLNQSFWGEGGKEQVFVINVRGGGGLCVQTGEERDL